MLLIPFIEFLMEMKCLCQAHSYSWSDLEGPRQLNSNTSLGTLARLSGKPGSDGPLFLHIVSDPSLWYLGFSYDSLALQEHVFQEREVETDLSEGLDQETGTVVTSGKSYRSCNRRGFPLQFREKGQSPLNGKTSKEFVAIFYLP